MENRGKLQSKPMPVGRSIQWKPLNDSYHLLASMLRRPADDYALFVTQRFLLRLGDQIRASEEPHAFGLLLGRRYRCSRSGVRYWIVDEAVPIAGTACDDPRTTDLQRVRTVLSGDRARAYGKALGWYCRRSEIGVRMSPQDERLHIECFRQPWHAALLMNQLAVYPLGAFYLYDPKVERSYPAPFFELTDDAPSKRRVRRQTLVNWYNYVTSDAVELANGKKRELLQQTPDEAQSNGQGALGRAVAHMREWMGRSRIPTDQQDSDRQDSDQQNSDQQNSDQQKPDSPSESTDSSLTPTSTG